ncbi:MAG TPA: sigma-70 family RNA polymerase sigma factor [Luteolibacter sp.]
MRAVAQGSSESALPWPVDPGRDGGDVAAAGEPSLREVFEAEETPLLHYAYGLTGVRETAEDLVQEAFLRLHRHWHEVRQPRPWLYRCVRNLALNHLRRSRRESPLDQFHEIPSPAADAHLGRLEAMGTLRQLMAELGEDDRRLLELKYREELKYDQIAARTGLSAGNVGYKLHHLLKNLADSLRRLGVESADG